MSKVIKGGTIVAADRSYRADILIEGEKIVSIGENLSGDTVIDAEGALIMQEAFELGLQQEKPFYSILITMMNKDTPAEFKKGLVGMDVGYLGAGGESYRKDNEAAYQEGFLSASGGYAHDAA